MKARYLRDANECRRMEDCRNAGWHPAESAAFVSSCADFWLMLHRDVEFNL